MAVLRYFHQDPRKTVNESLIQDSKGYTLTTKLGTINNSLTQVVNNVDDKVDKESGKGLSTNDFTNAAKDKLDGIEYGAEVNVQSDWNTIDETDDSYIKNKPESLPASDVYDWAKQPTKPSYTDAEIEGLSEHYIPVTQKGVYGGVATLGANDGKVPESQLPSYVDDVLEYTSSSLFPLVGESGKIYVNTTTNLTYRWTGTLYTEISPSIALGETSSTAYAGDKGKQLRIDLDNHILDDVRHITAAERAAWNAKTSNTGTVTSVAMTVPTGFSLTGSPITTSGTLALTFATGYALPTTAKQSNWDTAYGWGDHSKAGYVKSSGVTSIGISVPTGLSVSGSPVTSTGTIAIAFANGYSIPTTAKLSNWDTAYGWGNHAAQGYLKTIETTTATVGSASAGIAISADDITSWSAGSVPTLGTAIAADDITAWTTNTPTVVTKKTVVTGGSTTDVPNISKKTVVTGVAKKTVVTGGSTTDIPNISKKTVVTGVTKKTVVTGGSTTDIPNISKKTVVTGGSTTAVPNIAKKTVVVSTSVADGVLTISTGDSVTVGTAINAYTSLTTGDSVGVGTAIKAYTSLTTGDSVSVTTGDSVTVGDPIKAYTLLTTGDSVTVTTGDSVTVGTPIKAYTSLTTGDSVSVTAGTAASLSYTARSIPNVTNVGTAPSLSYTARSIPNISVTNKTVVDSVTAS